MHPWPLLLSVLTLAATAQNSAKSPTGSVTGHVYCADTNAPARMARVQLEPVTDAERRSAEQHGVPAGGVAQTGFDGAFILSNVPPGSYYVIAIKAGYLIPRIDNNDEGIDAAKPLSPASRPPQIIPTIDVLPHQTANIEIRLERGGAVSGTVSFDDGSPASGVQLMVLHRSKDKWTPARTPMYVMSNPPETDDMGHYRISGLRDREYVVMVQLSRTDLESRGAHATGLYGVERSLLRIYSGDTPLISNAVPFKLGAGEERSGEDITIPLSKFHTVSGVVTAASDGHLINSGHLVIEDQKNMESVVDAELGSDGAFHLEGVPEGTYTLRIRDARDQQIQEISVRGQQNFTFTKDNTLHQYGDLEQPIKVEGDIPNLILAVPDQTKQHASQ